MPFRKPLNTTILLNCVAALLLGGLADAAVAQPAFSKIFQPDRIGPGSVTALEFVIDNSTGGTPVSDLAFTDTLPAAVAIADPANASSTCGGTLSAPAGGGTITLSGGSVSAFSTCFVRVDVTSATAGVHSNVSGDLTSDAGNSGPAMDDLTVDLALPGFIKSFGPSGVQLGQRTTVTFTIDNTANADGRSNLTFSDSLPGGLEVADPANASTTCTGGVTMAMPGSGTVSYGPAFFGDASVPALDSCIVNVEVVATGVGAQDNVTGELTSTPAGSGFPTESSGRASDTLAVSVDELALTKSFTDDPVSPGGTVTLGFSITNFNRDDAATNVTFSDDLDATLSGLAPVPPLPTDPCGAGSALSSGPLALTGGNLGPGESCAIDITLQVPAGASPGVYPNTTSTVSGDVGGVPVVGAAASDDLYVQESPILTKALLDPGTLTPVSSVGAGEEVVLEFTVTNSSTAFGASNVEFADNLSDFLSGSAVTALPPAGACGAGSSVNSFTTTEGLFVALADGDLPNPGDSCTFQVTIQVPAATPIGTYTNLTSEVTALVNGETVTGPPASADLNVLAPPDFGKSFLSGTPPGGTVDLEFTLTLGENAPTPASGISFTDDLDATLSGLTAVALPADGFCGPGAQMTGVSLLTVTGASLDPGSSCTFQVTLQVPAGAIPGTYPNSTSQISATLDGEPVTGPEATADLEVIGLQLFKEFPDDPAVAGGTATLRLTLDNSVSPLAAGDISFTDDLGEFIPGMTASSLPADGFCGAGSQATQVGDLLTVSGASLAAGATCSFDFTVEVPAATASAVYTNTTSQVSATIGGEPAVVPAAGADLTVFDPLAISKSFIDDPVAPGDTVTLEFTLTNNSSTDSATGLTFTDDLDAALSGMTATGVPADGFCGAGSQATGGGVLTVTGANLAPGASCTFQVTVLVPAGTAAGTTVVNTTSQLSGDVGGVAATAPPASDVLRIDLVELTKSFAGPVGAGGTVILSFQIDNQSTSAVNGLGFTDDLGATLSGLQAVSLPADPCGAGSTITGSSVLVFSGGSLAVDGSCSFDVTLQVPAGAAPGLYPNTTSELTSQGQPLGTAAIADLQVEPPPAFAKSFAPATVGVGQTTALTFTIDNSASAIAATGLDFTDNLPAGLVVASPPNASTTCTGGTLTAVAGAGTISYTGGAVSAGASCSVQADVTATAPGILINTSGALTSSLGDSGTAEASLQVVESQLTFQKEFLGIGIPGGTVDLRFTLTNAFAEPLTDITYSDDLDAVVPGMESVGLPEPDVCGLGSQIAGTSVITLTGGVLPPGGACSFTVTVQLPPDAPAGEHTNVTSPVSFNREGVVLEGDPATAVLTVAAPPVFDKAFADSPLIIGVPTTLVFTIDNSANGIAADGLSFTDNLPAGLVVANPANASTTCTGGTLTASPGSSVISYSGGSVAAGATCTVRADVIASASGTLQNVSDPLSSSLGDSGAATATVEVQGQAVGVIPTTNRAAAAILALLLALAGLVAVRARIG